MIYYKRRFPQCLDIREIREEKCCLGNHFKIIIEVLKNMIADKWLSSYFAMRLFIVDKITSLVMIKFVREHWLRQGNVRELISIILWEPCNTCKRWPLIKAHCIIWTTKSNCKSWWKTARPVRQLQPLWGTLVDFHVYMFKPMITSTYYILANG